MCINVVPPRPEPNETEGFENDVAAFVMAWSRFVLHGLTLKEARGVLQSQTERLRLARPNARGWTMTDTPMTDADREWLMREYDKAPPLAPVTKAQITVATARHRPSARDEHPPTIGARTPRA